MAKLMEHESIMNKDTPIHAFGRGSTLTETTLSLGVLVSFLATGDETGGRFCVMEVQANQGVEAPPHVHDYENEYLYVLEGEIDYYCEDKILNAKAGQGVFLPQGRPHGPIIRSAYLRAIALVYASGEHPVGVDRFFLQTGTPAQSLVLPDTVTSPGSVGMEQLSQIAASTGVRMLSLEEVVEQLPLYPGLKDRSNTAEDHA